MTTPIRCAYMKHQPVANLPNVETEAVYDTARCADRSEDARSDYECWQLLKESSTPLTSLPWETLRTVNVLHIAFFAEMIMALSHGGTVEVGPRLVVNWDGRCVCPLGCRKKLSG